MTMLPWWVKAGAILLVFWITNTWLRVPDVAPVAPMWGVTEPGPMPRGFRPSYCRVPVHRKDAECLSTKYRQV